MQSHIHGLELSQANEHRCVNARKLGVALQSAAQVHISTTDVTLTEYMHYEPKYTSLIHGRDVNKTVKCASIQAGQGVVTQIKQSQGSKTVEGARLDECDGVVVDEAARSNQVGKCVDQVPVIHTESAAM